MIRFCCTIIFALLLHVPAQAASVTFSTEAQVVGSVDQDKLDWANSLGISYLDWEEGACKALYYYMRPNPHPNYLYIQAQGWIDENYCTITYDITSPSARL